MTGQLGLKLMRDGLCAGVDEAGRGPLAGPVVAAAVILDPKRRIRGVRDSKQVDPEEREALAVKIRQHALAWSVAWADVEEIDTHNILEATHLAMRRALMGLRIGPAHVQIDGNRCPAFSGLGLDCTFEPIIDGDALRVCIGAASILAKVTRDRMMTQLDQVYPQYGFAVHKGYGTPAHYDVLDAIGPSPIHRRSFEPVRLAEEAHLKRQMRKRRRSPSLTLPRGAGEGAAPAHPCAPLHSDSRPAESVEAAVMTALADAR